MNKRKGPAKKKFAQSPQATSRFKPSKAGTPGPRAGTGISSVSAKVDDILLTPTKKLVLLSNGQYRLGNRVFTPGQGYAIKHAEDVYFVVWDYDKERTRISKATAEQLINLAKTTRR